MRDGLTPGVRDDSKNLLYDTTVDDMKRPSIFVTYHDAQAYLEYPHPLQPGEPGAEPPQGEAARAGRLQAQLARGRGGRGGGAVGAGQR